MRYATSLAFALLALCGAARAQAAVEPTLNEFLNYCSAREPECIDLLGGDYTDMHDSLCEPDNYPADQAAAQVLADMKSIAAAQPARLSEGYDVVEMDVFKKLWRCN